jgi:predicted Zn finger-like uncharacterized protein
MIVSCPHCAAVYELPGHLMGPGGAAVRCRHCEGEFKVGPDGKTIDAGEGASLAAVGAAPAPGRARGATEAAGEGRGASAKEAGAPEAAAAASSGPAGASDPSAVARRVLDELAARKGPAMADANARGKLLSEFGTDLAAAFDEFRKASAGSGNPAPFRDALRERWGLDLTPPRAS